MDCEALFAHRRIETRWATAENPRGEKGGACRPTTRLNEGQAHLTHDRKVSPCLSPLRAGQSFVMAESTEGPGVVRRIWVTINDRTPRMLRGLRLEAFWDGAGQPAVSSPLGDFFCHALGRMSRFENALFSSPEGRSFTCSVPMPFHRDFRIVVTNESGIDLPMFFYEVDWTLGDDLGKDPLWFHAHFRRENPTVLRRDYEFLPALAGRGRLLGVNFGVIADLCAYHRSWWGEGEVKIWLDGDREHPTLCGTGTEDYIGTGWGLGAFANRTQGCHLADAERFHYGFYRLHLQDPVYFQHEIRASIQQIGWTGPDAREQMARRGQVLYHGDAPVDVKTVGIFERQDDWSSCAWFYLDRTTNGLPALSPVAERTAGLPLELPA